MVSTRGNQRLAKTTIPNIPLCNNLKWRSDCGLIGITHESMIGKKQITIRDTIINVTNKCEILVCHLTHNSRELINYFEWPSDNSKNNNQLPYDVNQINVWSIQIPKKSSAKLGNCNLNFAYLSTISV